MRRLCLHGVTQPYTTWPRWREQGGGLCSLPLVSGHLGFVADSLGVDADSIEFVAVFMTVGLLAVPDALLSSLDLASPCEQPWFFC